MNNRLKEIIVYKTAGRQKEFADLMGWKPPYLAKLLHGDNFGLQPVLTILERLPEIDARWFLLGDGTMLSGTGADFLLHGRILSLLEVERCLPVLTPSELSRLASSPSALPFSTSEIDAFKTRMQASNAPKTVVSPHKILKITANNKSIK